MALTPERLSPAVRVAVRVALFQPLALAEAFTVVLGACRSTWIPSSAALVRLPALSLTEVVAETLSPSPLITLLAGQPPSIPERVSSQVHWIITSPLYQPASLGLVVGAPLNVGLVLSMLMPPT